MLIWTSFMQVNTCMKIQIMVSLIQKKHRLYEGCYLCIIQLLMHSDWLPPSPVLQFQLKKERTGVKTPAYMLVWQTRQRLLNRLLPISRVHASWLHAPRHQSSCSNRLWIVEKLANLGFVRSQWRWPLTTPHLFRSSLSQSGCLCKDLKKFHQSVLDISCSQQCNRWTTWKHNIVFSYCGFRLNRSQSWSDGCYVIVRNCG